MNLMDWLTPWEFSPVLLATFLLVIVLYIRGRRVHRPNGVRQCFFWIGLVLLYLSLHTRLDYYAERMFFIHRAQHLILHHLGPLFLMGAYPGQTLRAGLPLVWRRRLAAWLRRPSGRRTQAVLTHPVLVAFLFVFLVLVWMLPVVQFYSMLDWRLYRLMNWSVVISGILYWNLILDRRPSPPARLSVGGRILSPVITMVPQMIVGAVITFTEYDLYPIFDLCGRAIAGMDAVADQVMGGLIMWVLAGLVEVFGLLYALGTLMRLSARNRLPESPRRPARVPAPAP
ncbi:MAG TPA: cytochrome c oxidase assembly protein [Alcaligenes sp.]|nr:cytochrome c oxidase assembly protein [Alcaligenes sp.]HRL26369.1 cytochrome c oxidase assembly protein [Alcaligenes sp.]